MFVCSTRSSLDRRHTKVSGAPLTDAFASILEHLEGLPGLLRLLQRGFSVFTCATRSLLIRQQHQACDTESGYPALQVAHSSLLKHCHCLSPDALTVEAPQILYDAHQPLINLLERPPGIDLVLPTADCSMARQDLDMH